MKVTKKHLFLAGESVLVEEFGRMCHSGGYTVSVRLNDRAAPIPGFAKQSRNIPRDAVLAVELTNTDRLLKRKNLQAIDKSCPRSTIILSSSITVTAAEQASWLRHPGRLVGISALPTLISQKLIEVAIPVVTSRSSVKAAQAFFSTLGKEVVVVQDRIGMVMPRILCALINEAYFAVMENIAHPHDIDAAMKLGANYPFGPVEWAEKIEIHQVFHVLEALHTDLREERYRIAPLLRQLATGNQWWDT